MATYRFYKIAEANAEIAKLEAKVTSLEAETKTATENVEAIAGPAQESANKLVQVEADLSTAKASISSLTARAEKAETDLKAANEKLANPSAQIKEVASRKALEITQAQGQPPVTPSTSSTTQTGDPVAQREAIKDPVARTEWYRKNKAAYDAAWRAQHPAKPDTTI